MDLRVRVRTGVALGVCLFGLAGVAAAQLTTGTVAGVVQDQQQATVPGATVTLISEARGTSLPPVVTNASGEFTFINVAPDSYKLVITLEGFKTIERGGVVVSPGDRVAVPTLRLEIGGAAETVTVTAETSFIQAQSGERSFSIGTTSVQNLPIQSRSFTQLSTLAPGVTLDGNNTPQRIGGGGSTNIMLDGISSLDTGSNRPILQVNVESIAEVKVLTSGYQAEFGRNSGVQVTAVTKSGTNQFRGSIYDVERNSNWNAISHTNKLNGDPKAVVKERDFGFSIGGPVGKPGGNNKLFFFYAQEFEPRQAGGDTYRYRVPTALERGGDFSQTFDNNGLPYNLIKDPNSTAACSATSTAGCFQDGGVLGKIPASRLYAPGLAILNTYPLPTLTGAAAAGLGYNYEVTRPVEKALSLQPTVKLDYQPAPSLRASFKYAAWRQRNDIFNGTVPGYNDSKMYKPIISTYAATLNYTVTSSTFVEITFGHARNDLTGCTLGLSATGPVFCTAGAPGVVPLPAAFAMNQMSNRLTAGLGGLPVLFNDPNLFMVDPSFLAYRALADVAPPFFVNGQALHTPQFTWGGRVANSPPNTPWPAFISNTRSYDLAGSVTKVRGRHTMKAGYYQTFNVRQQSPNNQQSVFGNLTFTNDTANPLDTTYPFANAAVGVVGSYNQFSKLIEANQVSWNIEGFVQDNWKVNSKLTLDYGLRLVHQTPTWDTHLFGSTFLPDQYSITAAPRLYVPGCAIGATSCTGTARQAMNPLNGQLLGAGSAVLIGTIVPNSGNTLNGIFQAGKGVEDTLYTWPAMGYAPRFGAAYDLTGEQKIVVRGGAGVYFDRPATFAANAQILNPPTLQNATVRNSQLQSLGTGSGAFIPISPAALGVFKHEMGLPSSTQWNVGVQLALPLTSTLDVSYVGQHAWNQWTGVNINTVDIGSAYLPANQDPTLTSTTPGANALPTDSLRSIRGFGAITQQQDIGWNTYHSLQLSFQRRFSKGMSFGFIDTMGLKNEVLIAPRLQHNADGTYSVRTDQAKAQSFLQTDPVRHTMKANFVWDLPDYRGNQAVNAILNDWQVSGVWTGATGAPYNVTFNYQGITPANLTGSPDFTPRIALVGDPGSGCGSDPLRQFNISAFAGPPVNLTGQDVGLESSPNAVKGCFLSVLDLAFARNIRLGGNRSLQFRLDMYNALNQAIVTGRVTAMQLGGLNAPGLATNSPFDASGNVIASRSLPKNAGFGVANAYQNPRTLQLTVRFGF